MIFKRKRTTIFFAFFFLVLFFSGIKNTKATELVCEYNVNGNATLIINLSRGSLTHIFDSSNVFHKEGNVNLKHSEFISQKDGSLFCNQRIRYNEKKSTTGGSVAIPTYTYDFETLNFNNYGDNFVSLEREYSPIVCQYRLNDSHTLEVAVNNNKLTAKIPEPLGSIGNNKLNLADFKDNAGNLNCRSSIAYKITSTSDYSGARTYSIDTELRDGYKSANLFNPDGNDSEDDESEDEEIIIGESITCDNFKIITQPLWMLIRIAAPIMLLVFGAVDFAKATAASDEKMMKKSVQTFVKRIIITIAIFLLPTIVNLIVGWTIYDNLTGCL